MGDRLGTLCAVGISFFNFFYISSYFYFNFGSMMCSIFCLLCFNLISSLHAFQNCPLTHLLLVALNNLRLLSLSKNWPFPPDPFLVLQALHSLIGYMTNKSLKDFCQFWFLFLAQGSFRQMIEIRRSFSNFSFLKKLSSFFRISWVKL